jgi:hypothetical protein
MSYCGPYWVSDYTWQKTHDQQRILTSWDYEDASGDEAFVEVLHGYVGPDGVEGFWTTLGQVPFWQLSEDHSVELWDDGELVEVGEVAQQWIFDGLESRYFMAEIPWGLEGVDEIVIVAAGERIVVDRESVQRHIPDAEPKDQIAQ